MTCDVKNSTTYTFSYNGDACLVYDKKTMPYMKNWDEAACQNGFMGEMEARPEMLKPERSMKETALKFHKQVFRLAGNNGCPGQLVTLDLDAAHELSRWVNHNSVYCIKENKHYQQGDATTIGMFEEEDPDRVVSDLERLFLWASSFEVPRKRE